MTDPDPEGKSLTQQPLVNARVRSVQPLDQSRAFCSSDVDKVMVTSAISSFGRDFFSTDAIVAAKGHTTVSVIIPARNEAATIAAVIAAVRDPHVGPASSGLVDEILVVDDGSSDGTGDIARSSGASVVTLAGSGGKGQAMWAGLIEARGTYAVFLDGDVENTHDRYVPSLVGPLVLQQGIKLVKGFYERPFHDHPTGGGRVTELVAHPLLDLLFPELSSLHQPLAGETAGAKATLMDIGFADNYGVEFGLLVDVASRFGAAAIAEVDLGVRIHRNRPLNELRPMAADIIEAALTRAGAASLLRSPSRQAN